MGTPKVVNENSRPSGDRVLLIRGITGVLHTPRIVEGFVSSSGKTISVEDDRMSDSYRLKSDRIFGGETEFRDATTFELYTYSRMERNQRANYQPGPVAGCNQKDDREDLPTPTHVHESESDEYDLSDESESNSVENSATENDSDDESNYGSFSYRGYEISGADKKYSIEYNGVEMKTFQGDGAFYRAKDWVDDKISEESDVSSESSSNNSGSSDEGSEESVGEMMERSSAFS